MKKSSYIVMSVILLSISSLFSQCSGEKEGVDTIKTVSAERFVMVIDSLEKEKQNNNKISEIQLIDVRTPAEWENGTIEKAFRIDYLGESFSSKVEKLDTSEAVMVFCASGNRSFKAAKLLKKKGFKDIYNLDGGYRDLITKKQ